MRRRRGNPNLPFFSTLKKGKGVGLSNIRQEKKEAAEVEENLSTIGGNPINERQAREIAERLRVCLRKESARIY
jgi:hypothetical protein